MNTRVKIKSAAGLIVALLASVLVLDGCGHKETTIPATGGADASATMPSTSPTPTILPSASPASSPSASSPSAAAPSAADSSDTVEHTFYLSGPEGWRVDTTPIGMHQEEWKIYKTNDGGETFQLVADSTKQGSKTPGGVMAGMVFLDSNRGWIISNAPWGGKLGLFRTKDGGASWEEQLTDKVPKSFADSEIWADSIYFLDDQTGLILAHIPTEENQSLFFLSTDAGETWRPIADKLEGNADGLEWTFTRNASGILQGKVRYNHDEWDTAGGGWTREFLPGVFVTDGEFADDSKKKMLADLVIENLKAIVAKDWKAFGANMESPALTEAMRITFDNSNTYRFIGIDQIYALGDDPNRMNVDVVTEEKLADGNIQKRTIAYTLRPDKKGKWRIAEID